MGALRKKNKPAKLGNHKIVKCVYMKKEPNYSKSSLHCLCPNLSFVTIAGMTDYKRGLCQVKASSEEPKVCINFDGYWVFILLDVICAQCQLTGFSEVYEVTHSVCKYFYVLSGISFLNYAFLCISSSEDYCTPRE